MGLGGSDGRRASILLDPSFALLVTRRHEAPREQGPTPLGVPRRATLCLRWSAAGAARSAAILSGDPLRRQGGSDAASARYIYTQLKAYSRLLFPEADDEVRSTAPGPCARNLRRRAAMDGRCAG